MWFFIGLILFLFILGLLFRDKGDGFLDTLGSGCSAVFWFILIGVVIIIVITANA